MPERTERYLKLLCVVLAAVFLCQFSLLVFRRNPLAKLAIPAVPTLGGATNSAAAGTNQVTGSRGTNLTPAMAGASAVQTNSTAGMERGGLGTNALSRRGSATPRSNSIPDAAANGPEAAAFRTNAPPRTVLAGEPGTAVRGMEPVMPGEVAMARAGGARRGGRAGAGPGGLNMVMAMRGGMMGGGMVTLPELPAATKARVERIYRSELFGPVIPPVPAALLGIAGDRAFLRATNGQSGPVKEGDSLGGLRLLKIGVNRVLVEDGGQQKELTIFSGFGGESLMTKPGENPQ